MSHPGLPDAAAFRDLLSRAGDATRMCVAFSGGADSTALLHRLATLRGKLDAVSLRAVHVNHGLQPTAAGWAEHCRRRSAELDVECVVIAVDATPLPGESPEDAARTARYRAISALLGAGEVLLTAQHADDQAETLLLQLLRGAGPAGLAGMPMLRPFARGWIARPLLGLPRAVLRRYCLAQALTWIEDPANQDSRHDRSHLRTGIMPMLAKRWPAAATTLSRAAAHQAGAVQLLAEVAREDLGDALDDETLAVAALEPLSRLRRGNALRWWLHRQAASMPSTAQLEQMLTGVVAARIDATPEARWGSFLLRRHGGRLYLLHRGPEPGPERSVWADPSRTLELDHGRLLVRACLGAGVRTASLAGDDVVVRLRSGGERIRPAGDRHTRRLKKLLQARGIPPWQRRGLPLVYVGEELVAVPGVCIASAHAAGPDETGLWIDWQPDRPMGRDDDDG